MFFYLLEYSMMRSEPEFDYRKDSGYTIGRERTTTNHHISNLIKGDILFDYQRIDGAASTIISNYSCLSEYIKYDQKYDYFC